MKNIGNLKVSNKDFDLISENLHIVKERPCAFYVTSANQAKIIKKINDITKWAEKLVAKVTYLGEHRIHPMIEITDPVAAQLEKHFQ